MKAVGQMQIIEAHIQVQHLGDDGRGALDADAFGTDTQACGDAVERHTHGEGGDGCHAGYTDANSNNKGAATTILHKNSFCDNFY